VKTGDWKPFTDGFADDGALEFVGRSLGPFTGRAAIHEAYAQNPPDDTIELAAPVVAESDELVVRYRWVTTGATGTMRVRGRGALIVRLVIAFD
jgi:hypothetical protein